ncbi:hypothetical protein C8Q76DRAFT_794467 [Earliella scabrosa]|nr:hypothetical protein C8Q76DRAFT_794467 [Earliella scabrosa]
MPYIPHRATGYPYQTTTVTHTATVTAYYPPPPSSSSSSQALDRLSLVANIWGVSTIALSILSAIIKGYKSTLPSQEQITYFHGILDGWSSWLRELEPHEREYFNNVNPMLLKDIQSTITRHDRELRGLIGDFERAGIYQRYAMWSGLSTRFNRAHTKITEMDQSFRSSTQPFSTPTDMAFNQPIDLPSTLMRPPPPAPSFAQSAWSAGSSVAGSIRDQGIRLKRAVAGIEWNRVPIPGLRSIGTTCGNVATSVGA